MNDIVYFWLSWGQKECIDPWLSWSLSHNQKILKIREVNAKSIPIVNRLRSEDLYDFIVKHCGAAEYMPSLKCCRFSNQQWIANIDRTFSNV